MAIVFLFEIPGGTQAMYDASVKKLEAAGAMTQPARSYHVAGPSENGWRVVDVWESKEACDKFFQDHLGQVLKEVGMPQPQITTWPAHNIVK